MTKVEMLNILYAERERVVKQYSQPGWTKWAIYAAMASLCWMAWNLADQSKDWTYSIFVFYGLFHVVLIGASIIAAFPTHRGIPMFSKNDIGEKVRAVVMSGLLIGLLVSQWFLIPHDFCPVLYWMAFGCNCVHAFICLLNILMAKTGHVKMAWDWWDVFIVLLYAPALILIVMYLWQMGYNPIALRMGVLLYAVYFLFVLIPFGEANDFSQIDELINKVLYGEEQMNEKEVLDELELYVVGLRYGKYLSAKKLKGLKESVSPLLHYTPGMIQVLKEAPDIEIETVLYHGQQFYDAMHRDYMDIMRDINQIYGENIGEDTSLMHILAVGKIAQEEMKFWKEALAHKNDSREEFVKRMTQVYMQTIGKPEVRRLIEMEMKDV